MARRSEPVSLRTGLTTYWQYKGYSVPSSYNFLQDYWLLQSFRKLFEATRARITIYTDIKIGIYYIYVQILLLLIENNIIRRRKKILKRRILFILFKRVLRWRRQSIKPFINFSRYNKVLRLITNKNKRFLAYCNLACRKFRRRLASSLINAHKSFNAKGTNLSELPYKLKVNNLFSIMDRSYLYIWKHFYIVVCNQLWFAKSMRYFVATVKLCFITLFVTSTQLIADHLAYLLKKSRKHWQIIKTIKQLLVIMGWFSPQFRNIKIQIKGCIQDASRTRSITLGQNSVILHTFTKPLEFALAHAATPFGSLGIKIWIIK